MKKAAVKTTGGIPNKTSQVGAGGEFKAGPPSPRDMGKTRGQVAYAAGGMYTAGQPSQRGLGKKGAKPF